MELGNYSALLLGKTVPCFPWLGGGEKPSHKVLGRGAHGMELS